MISFFRNQSKMTAISLLASCSMISINAGAAAQSSDDETVDDVVVVTGIKSFRDNAASGTGFDLDLVETPFSISVVSRELLETTNSFNAVQASNLIGNLGAVQVSGGVNTDYFARGFTLDTVTGFKQNGVPIVRDFVMDLAAVERIEYIKGPSSIEFGRANPGGVINVVTKTPQAEAAYSGRLIAGSDDFYRAEADATGSINDRLRYRVVGAYENAGSFIDHVESESVIFAPSLEYDISDRTLLQAIGYAQQVDTVPEAGVSTNEFGEIPVSLFEDNRGLFTGERWAYANTNAQSAQLILTHEFNENFTGKVSAFYTGSSFQRRYARPRFVVFENDFDIGGGLIVPAGSVQQYQIRRPQGGENRTLGQQAELRYDFDLGGREHSFVFTGEHISFDFEGESWGGDRTFDDFDFRPADGLFGYNILNPADVGLPAVSFGGISKSEQEVFSGSFQALLRPLDFLTVTGGLRYDTVEASSESDILEVDDITFNVGGLINVFSDAGVIDQLNLYGNYATSFFPTFAQTGQIINGVEMAGDVLDPETGKQIEAGLKAELLDGELLVTLAAFKIERNDIAVDDFNFGGAFSLPAGSQESQGFEAELVGRITPNWRVFFAYAYLDTENTETGSGEPDDPVLGRPIANAPDHSASFYTNYRFEESGLGGGLLDGLQIGGGFVYRGERAGNDFIRSPVGFLGLDGFFTVPSDFVVNFDARYPITDIVSVSVNVTNAFNELGFDSSFSWNGSGIKPIPPRQVRAALNMSW